MSIFWDFSNYDKIELLPCPIITTGTQDMGNGVYKLAAGTPLKKSTQAVSNDANADCVVAEDYFFISTKADQSKLVPVITKGYVGKALAESAWGGEFTDAAVSALETAGIFLVDGALEAGGDPGYDVETVTTSVIPEQTVSVTPPVSELTVAAGLDAIPDSLTVVLDGVEHETTIAVDAPNFRTFSADDESFNVIFGMDGASLYAEIGGESLPESITVEAYNEETTITVTDEFKAAVKLASPVQIVHGAYNEADNIELDKTWQEIYDAADYPIYCFYRSSLNGAPNMDLVSSVMPGEVGYRVNTLGGLEFTADSASDYPVSVEG